MPWTEYRTCVSGCGDKRYTTVERSRSTRPVLGLAAIPSYRLGEDLVAYGGLSVRNHPTIPRESVEAGVLRSSRLRSGPFNPILSAGLEYEMPIGARLSGRLDQPLRANPVRYGPSLGVTLAVPLGRGS